MSLVPSIFESTILFFLVGTFFLFTHKNPSVWNTQRSKKCSKIHLHFGIPERAFKKSVHTHAPRILEKSSPNQFHFVYVKFTLKERWTTKQIIAITIILPNIFKSNEFHQIWRITFLELLSVDWRSIARTESIFEQSSRSTRTKKTE